MKGVWFDDIHSYNDLNLVMGKPTIPPAEAKTNFVDIPGGDGSVDLTEALGEIRYKDRACTFPFTVFPHEDFEEKKRIVSNLLNGRRFKIRLDKDPNYYWVGRCSINEYASDKNLHKIVVGAIVSPYKLKKEKTIVNIPAGNNVIVTLKNGRKSVVPTIVNRESAKIVFDGNTYDMNAGTHTLLNIELKEGDNIVSVTSTSDVQFSYQEGDL